MITDNDFYNFTMGQLVWLQFPDVEVCYAFKCRTKIPLGDMIKIEDLQAEIEWYSLSQVNPVERDYLLATDVLRPAYIDWLLTQDLPMPEVSKIGSELEITITGPWSTAIFWETPLLYIINNLAHRNTRTEHDPVVTGMERLQAKVQILKQNPQIHFFDFGTRRRHSHSWQFNVLGYLQSFAPANILGTSNVYFGSRLGIPIRGTIAHQLYMVNAALKLKEEFNKLAPNPEKALARSIFEINELWEDEYEDYWNNGLLVGLPDTFGSDHYFEQMRHADFVKWRGFRQDSGDPFEFAEKVLHYWGLHGVDPKSKLLAFSDGLDLESMLRLHERYHSQTDVVFGWGTNLTNDVGIDPISMVVKPILANGAPCVKLSDNLAKATGDSSTISAYKRLTQYSSEYSKMALY